MLRGVQQLRRLALDKTSRVASYVLNLANKFVFFFLDEDRELLMSQHGKPDAVLSLVYVVYIEKTTSVFEQRSLVSNVLLYFFFLHVIYNSSCF